MIRKFLNNNKIILTNMLMFSLLVGSYFLRGQECYKIQIIMKAMGCMGLICSLVNWLALQILLEKLSFLYTMDKIRNNMEPLRIFLIKDIFSKKNYDRLRKKYEPILLEEDKIKIEENIDNLGLNNIIKAFNNPKTRYMIRKSLINNIFDIQACIKNKILYGLRDNERDKSSRQFFNQEILPIIENKIEFCILVNMQANIYNAIKNYFSWLVLWGAYCGAIFGLIFKFTGCL